MSPLFIYCLNFRYEHISPIQQGEILFLCARPRPVLYERTIRTFKTVKNRVVITINSTISRVTVNGFRGYSIFHSCIHTLLMTPPLLMMLYIFSFRSFSFSNS